MNDLAPDGVAIQAAMLDAISDAMSAAILIYDRDDNLVFASHRLFTLLPLENFSVGAREVSVPNQSTAPIGNKAAVRDGGGE